jgi:hypothetical protein
LGQKRRFDALPVTSGLPRTTDIIRPARLIRFVPRTEVTIALKVDGFMDFDLQSLEQGLALFGSDAGFLIGP